MLKSSIGVFLVALNIVLGIVLVAWLHSPPHGYERSAHGASSPAVSELLNTPVSKDGGRGKESRHGWFMDHLPDWFVAIFTGLLVYVTYRLVKATGDLRQSTDKLWEAGERQIGVAQQSASAAERSARTADAALRI